MLTHTLLQRKEANKIDTTVEILYHLRKLEALLESDYNTADQNMQGGFVIPYRRCVKKEMDQLQKMIQNVRDQF